MSSNVFKIYFHFNKCESKSFHFISPPGKKLYFGVKKLSLKKKKYYLEKEISSYQVKFQWRHFFMNKNIRQILGTCWVAIRKLPKIALWNFNWNTHYLIRSQTFLIKISSEHDSLELAWKSRQSFSFEVKFQEILKAFH